MRNWIIIVGFLLLLAFPAVQTFFGTVTDQRFALRERKTASLPEMLRRASVWDAPKKIDAYIEKNLGLRPVMVTAANSLRYNLFGVSPTHKVTVGRNGWLFYGSRKLIRTAQGIERFSSRELVAIRRNLAARREFLEYLGIRYLFVQVPSKETVYPEFYDPRYPKISEETKGVQLRNMLRAEESPFFVDMTERVLAAKARYDVPIYKRTDSHWNDLAAFEGYQVLVEKMQTFFPGIKPVSAAEFKMTTTPYEGRGLARMLGVFPQPRGEVVKMKPKRPLEVREQSKAIDDEVEEDLTRRSPIVIRNRRCLTPQDCPNLIPKIMVYRNSFFARMTKFLTYNTREAKYYSSHYFRFDPDEIWRENPSAVIEQITDIDPAVPRPVDSLVMQMPKWKRIFDAGDRDRRHSLMDLLKLRQGCDEEQPLECSSGACEVPLTDQKCMALVSYLPEYEGDGKLVIKVSLTAQNRGTLRMRYNQKGDEPEEFYLPVHEGLNKYYVPVPSGRRLRIKAPDLTYALNKFEAQPPAS